MSEPSEMALVTVEGDGKPPSLESAAAQLGVTVEDIDAQFDMIALDTTGRLYTVRVRADRLPNNFADRDPYEGPFSDPPIAGFGPPRSERDRKK